ncbi:Cache 3/Cache 2 fusion domain-containing protein, partial [Thioalkalivibrio sp. XN279]|uniref:Cache 3/Cache 2 fusion domain-containing protein n=1 Tax=Thioalkalivibrio sp. XN279 TaxID=2714953 RepID=UPI00198037C6
MKLRLNDFTLQTRIALPVSLFIVAVVLGGAAGLALLDSQRVTAEVTEDAADREGAILGMLEITDKLVMDRVKGAMAVLKERGAELGPARLDPQNPVQVGERTVPQLMLGEEPQVNRFGLVDGLTRNLGGTATLFVRSGEDYVRVSTNVINAGKRAIGTVLDPQGLAIKAIRQGEAFYGLVDILGRPFITGYEPIRNPEGQVIGIWYVGNPLNMDVLDKQVASTRLLDSGFFALVDRRGEIRFHSESVSPELVASVLEAPEGWVLGESNFDPWGFRVVGAYRADEVQALWVTRVLVTLGLGLAACLLLVGMLAWMVRRMVTRPLGGEPGYAAAVAGRLADGQLGEEVDLRPGDNDSVLAAMARARGSIRGLMDEMRRMSAEHDKGDIDVVIDADKFTGDYATVAQGVNDMVNGHIAVKKKAMGCVGEFGRGNFEAELEKF